MITTCDPRKKELNERNFNIEQWLTKAHTKELSLLRKILSLYYCINM